METEFFGTGESYQVTATLFPPEGKGFDDRRDIKRFAFWDKKEYIRKRLDLMEAPEVESIYCIETHTTTIFSLRKRNKINV